MWGALCWPLEKSGLAEESAGPAGTALLGAWPPAEQGPVLCLTLPGRQRSSLTSSLKSPQVSCGSQQILRRKNLSASPWDPFFWEELLERFPCLSKVQEETELQTGFCNARPTQWRILVNSWDSNDFMALEAKGAEICSQTAELEWVIINLGTAELLLLLPYVFYTCTRANTLCFSNL